MVQLFKEIVDPSKRSFLHTKPLKIEVQSERLYQMSQARVFIETLLEGEEIAYAGWSFLESHRNLLKGVAPHELAEAEGDESAATKSLTIPN